MKGRILVLFLIICAGCKDKTPVKTPSQTIVYDKSDGLIQFVDDHLQHFEMDNMRLVFTNNRKCNCGGSNFEQIDSLIETTTSSFPVLWVLTETDTGYEHKITAQNQQFFYLHNINPRRYGISAISPQCFTIKDRKVIEYKRIPH